MNVTKLHKDCKEQARKCFEAFKHTIKTFPFDGEVDVEMAINTEIKESFGGKVLNKHLTGSESKEQFEILTGIVNDYRKLLITTSRNWFKKYSGK